MARKPPSANSADSQSANCADPHSKGMGESAHRHGSGSEGGSADLQIPLTAMAQRPELVEQVRARHPGFCEQGVESAFMMEIIAETMVMDIELGLAEAANGLLRLCATLLRLGRPLPTAAAEFLADRFEAIEREEVPWGKALLKRKPGQKSPELQQKAKEIAFEYWVLTRRQGVSQKDAHAQLKKRFHVASEQVVKNAWTDHGHLFESFPAEYMAWASDEEYLGDSD